MSSPTQECSASHLRELLAKHHPDHCMAFADLFAMGCLLHLQGQTRAGRKAVSEVLGAVAAHGSKAYASSILSNLEGNEIRLAEEIWAHEEINQLIREAKQPEIATAGECS